MHPSDRANHTESSDKPSRLAVKWAELRGMVLSQPSFDLRARTTNKNTGTGRMLVE